MTQTSDTFWADYITEAMSFAVLPATDPRAQNEASFGLIEEAGEVAGVFKREARGDAGGLDRFKLTKELGDLWWYIVRCAIVCERLAPRQVARLFEAQEMEHEDADRMVSYMVPNYLSTIFPDCTMSRIRKLIHITQYAQLDMREVVATNLDKLQARRVAGTIQGKGDNR